MDKALLSDLESKETLCQNEIIQYEEFKTHCDINMGNNHNRITHLSLSGKIIKKISLFT